MEKAPLLPVEQQARAAAPNGYARRLTKFLLLTICAGCVAYQWSPSFFRSHSHHGHRHHASTESLCAQPAPLFPPADNEALQQMWDYLHTPAFENASIIRHSGAVKIPTQSFDDMGKIGEDKRWDILYEFADYLEATFPRTHSDLKVEKVNTHGLVYTWQGSDEKLKPLILMAHQDVVPVPDATVDAWDHPPFSGFFDGKFIWGRGSSDCKNQLIAIMESIELFLDAGFEPKRTIILSFGFDEEISGREGAGHLAPFLHERYGDDGIAAIVDEGAGLTTAW